MSMTAETSLRELARSYGVSTEYLDTAGRLRVTTPDTLLAVLRSMGVSVGMMSITGETLQSRLAELKARWLEPVHVVWDRSEAIIPLNLVEPTQSLRLDCRLVTEEGEERHWTVTIPQAATPTLTIPGELATGYHRLTVSKAGDSRDCLVIVAATRAYDGTDGRSWGLFCPLYSLRHRTGWGAGDYSDLKEFMSWTADLGGSIVGTLPMLAATFDRKPWISPYSPASRLFGNEFYLDLEAIPDLAECKPARDLMKSADFRRHVDALRSAKLVDYGREMFLKRSVLELLADYVLPEGEEPRLGFRAFLAASPEAIPFAEFMAGAEPGGLSERSVRYHLYAQWQIEVQQRALAALAESRGLTWYVDFTVGVDPLSYDVRSRPHLFALDAAVGCPPDGGFTKGQNWGFPPPIPDRQREEGHAYFIAAIRSHLRHAGALRIDHAMGLHRLYWIPHGHDEGAYVTYPAEEQYAILSVESHRRKAWIAGEDLGTVPAEVRPAMRRHGLRSLFVAQHAMSSEADSMLGDMPPEVVASVNTHDMAMFASYWAGRDIDDRVELGLLNEASAAHERSERPGRLRDFSALLIGHGLLDADQAHDVTTIHRACCELLAASPIRTLLINPEDLWGETEPQNMPGTTDECPNWRRRFHLSFEEFAADPQVVEALRRVDRLRRDGAPAR